MNKELIIKIIAIYIIREKIQMILYKLNELIWNFQYTVNNLILKFWNFFYLFNKFMLLSLLKIIEQLILSYFIKGIWFLNIDLFFYFFIIKSDQFCLIWKFATHYIFFIKNFLLLVFKSWFNLKNSILIILNNFCILYIFLINCLGLYLFFLLIPFKYLFFFFFYQKFNIFS